MIVTAGSIWLALQVAPLQTVSAAGQTAQVGAAVPDFSLSGPGELDLFGQVVPTKPQFTGPIRPLLKLTHITIDDEVARVLRSDSPRTLELNRAAAVAYALGRKPLLAPLGGSTWFLVSGASMTLAIARSRVTGFYWAGECEMANVAGSGVR